VCGGCFLGLGIVRSLGMQGIPVCVIDDEYSISGHSRFATHSVRVANLRDEQAIVETVLGVGARLGLVGWLLYPSRDEMVAAFSRHRSRLGEQFRVATPGWDTVRWAWDKRNTYRLAAELGIPTPRTWNPHDVTELEEVDIEPPYAIKPAIKEHFFYATKAKAWRADTRAELEARYRQAAALVGPEEVIIQELVPGDGRHQYAYCAFFKDGNAVGVMMARRRRQHPPGFGRASTFVETVDIPELETYSERFLRAIDAYGLVEVEYKLDPRDGQYKLLDVNLRAWGYHSLGARAGVDFPYLLFLDQMGERVEPCRARPDVRWIRLVTDLPTAVVELASGRLNLRSYLRSIRASDVESVFSRADPLPSLVEIALIPYLSIRRGF
jgi:D-aspartate ligase